MTRRPFRERRSVGTDSSTDAAVNLYHPSNMRVAGSGGNKTYFFITEHADRARQRQRHRR